MLYRDTAIVLRTYKLGEADRIVVLLTRGRGKVRAVAKGVRKTRSRFGSRMEPTSHVNVQLHAGRDLHTVTQADTVETFPHIRADLDRLGRAAAILEVVDQVATEADEHGEAHEELYQLLLGGLRAIEHRPSPLVAPAFFLKLLTTEGVGFSIDGCIECGRDDELVALDLECGGLRCSVHREGTAVTPDAIVLLQAILGGHLAWALDQPTTPATWEVDHLAQVAIEHHIARRLRALRLIASE